MKNILSMAPILVVFCLVTPVSADFSFRPGFGTKEGVLGSGYKPPPTQQDYRPQQASPPPVPQPKIDHEKRRAKEKQARRLEQRRKKALRSVHRELAEIEPVRVEAGFTAEPVSAGNAFFGLGGTPGFQAKRPTGYTAPSEVSTENLRRAVSILKPVAAARTSSHDLSDEDMRFLADQAGLALVGAPLQVKVPLAPQADRMSDSDLHDALDHLKAIGQGMDELSGAVEARLELEKEMSLYETHIDKFHKQGDYGSGYREASAKLRDLKQKYRTAREHEQNVHRALESLRKQFRESVGIEIAQ